LYIIKSETSLHYYLKSIKNHENDFYTMNKELCEEKLLKFRDSILCYIKLVQVSDVFHVRKSMWLDNAPIWGFNGVLTPIGEECLTAIDNGYCWNVNTQQIDLEYTLEYYTNYIHIEPNIKSIIFDHISKLNEVCFNEIKADFMRLKLEGVYNQTIDSYENSETFLRKNKEI